MATFPETENKPDTAGAQVALAAVDAGLPYLGDIEAVDGLFRAFAKDICDRYGKVAATEMLPEAAKQADMAEAVRLARIFLGKDPGYTPVGPWNGAPLAAVCRARFKDVVAAELMASDKDAVEAATALFVHGLYDVLRGISLDESFDDMALATDALVEDWTHLMLGLPPSNEADNAEA